MISATNGRGLYPFSPKHPVSNIGCIETNCCGFGTFGLNLPAAANRSSRKRFQRPDIRAIETIDRKSPTKLLLRDRLTDDNPTMRQDAKSRGSESYT